MADNSQLMKCIILTLKKENVLIPGALVAEILSVENIQKIPDSPHWFVGKIKWRGEDIPLVSFEAVSEQSEVVLNRSTQVAVLYALNDDTELASPYIGLMITGVPHVNRFSADQLKTDEEVSVEHSMVAQRIKVNGVSMSILDIDAMELMIVESNI